MFYHSALFDVFFGKHMRDIQCYFLFNSSFKCIDFRLKIIRVLLVAVEIMHSGLLKCFKSGTKEPFPILTAISTYANFDRGTPSEILRIENKKIDAKYPKLSEAERFRMKYKNMNEIAKS